MTRAMLLALILALPTVLRADTVTQCYTSASEDIFGAANEDALPMFAGMTRMRAYGSVTYNIANQSFWDGLNAGDPLSYNVNALTGATDCDQNIDSRYAWGYNFQDESTTACMTFDLTLTTRYLEDPNQAPGCGWPGDFTSVYAYTVTTCPDLTLVWRESSSIHVSVGKFCEPGLVTHHYRTTATAQLGTLPPATANGCWREWHGEDICPGNDDSCI